MARRPNIEPRAPLRRRISGLHLSTLKAEQRLGKLQERRADAEKTLFNEERDYLISRSSIGEFRSFRGATAARRRVAQLTSLMSERSAEAERVRQELAAIRKDIARKAARLRKRPAKP